MLDIFYFTGTWFTILGVIFYRYERWERFAKESDRDAFRRWLRQPTLGRAIPSSWPRPFIASFDKFFGEKHFSWRCFLKSCIASFAFAVLTCLFFYIWHHKSLYEALQENTDNKWLLAIRFGTYPLILNFIPDYIALLKSRAIVYYLGTHNVGTKPPTIRIILFDLFINFIISSTALFLFCIMTGYQIEDKQRFWIRPIPDPGMPDPPLGEPFYLTIRYTVHDFFVGAVFFYNSFSIFFYSTFFTSVWIWSFVVAGFIIKLLRRIDERMKSLNFRRFVDEEAMNKEPIACYGYILTVKVAIPIIIFIDLILRIRWLLR
jgi:hypothetical protein